MKYLKTILTLLLLSTQFAFGQMKADWIFRDELMVHLLSPNDTVYIFDRHSLEKFSGLRSSDTASTINYTTKAGEEIYISLQTAKFDPTKHPLHLTDPGDKPNTLIAVNVIDGKEAFGVDGEQPRTEIKELKVRWNTKWLMIPDSFFAPFYEIHPESMEAYISKDQNLVFIYFSASDGAGGYAVKFVFDKKSVVTRLISTNECTNGYDFIDALPADCN